jgi:hypothetical protein
MKGFSFIGLIPGLAEEVIINNISSRGILEKIIVQSKLCPNVKIEVEVGDMIV